ncbi:hypothetical protein AAYR18_03785 [Leuconostoc fallax]|uniref:DUF7671 family protein n=1 Tax=Leuconostoc fallax TaxID=1251 RepID=UPI002091D71E|nr:hypothetical protein [Leuconostoc fallax]MCO6183804.1 hypothetical protein [Leuconostoc fallax]
MSKSKYDTQKFFGIVVKQDASGQYLPDANAKVNVWRTGKHTKGTFSKIGQVFLTENNRFVAVLHTADLPFNQRHDFVPLQRWTHEVVAEKYLTHFLSEFQ